MKFPIGSRVKIIGALIYNGYTLSKTLIGKSGIVHETCNGEPSCRVIKIDNGSTRHIHMSNLKEADIAERFME